MHVRALNSIGSVQHLGDSTSVAKHAFQPFMVKIVLALIAQRQNDTLKG